MNKNILIFGGSFDPIHNGHIQLIQQSFLQINADEVWIVPTGCHPENKIFSFTDQERLLMIRGCLGLLSEKDKEFLSKEYHITADQNNSYKHVVIREDEMNMQTCSYTINFIKKVIKEYPKYRFHLLVGADQAAQFSSWFCAGEIALLVTLWTFPRENFIPDSRFVWNILDAPIISISSSDIRLLLKNSQSLERNGIPLFIQKLAPIFYKKNKGREK